MLPAEELAANRSDQAVDTARYKFRDEEYYKSRDYSLADIEVPVLSVANWGGIHLHLRGNVFGYLGISSKLKYLRFITGRHDNPFFFDQEVAVQKSFLDAFLKDNDSVGWSIPGKVPPVSLCLRQGNPGYNNPEAERKAFTRRDEWEWPIARTDYRNFHLSTDMLLKAALAVTEGNDAGLIRYSAPSGNVKFSAIFTEETEMTGHPMLRLSISALEHEGQRPSEIDIFVTLRHLDADGNESK